VSAPGMKMYVTDFSTWAVGTTVIKDVLSESVTGTIREISVAWVTAFGCLLCDIESSVAVSVTPGGGPSRES